MTVAADLDLLATDLATLFVTSPTGRIARVNSPDGEAGPRLVLAGCRAGNLLRLRHDVDEAAARDVAAVVRDEPPWFDAAAPPPCLPAIVARLSRDAPVESIVRGIIYVLPNGVRHEAPARIVSEEEPEGRDLMDRLARQGMPEALRDAGFLSVADFWAPWCVALADDQIAAMAFAARLGEGGAEVGVYTFPGFRGQGFAAAVTARWSSLAALAGKRLFYSTQTTNRASQRVAERLGLATLGCTASVT